MMSERSYYHDAYTRQFTANIVEQAPQNGRLAVVLDRSYFYPTSGGQPADQGEMNGRRVYDVSIRADDGAVLHWLEGEGPLAVGQVTAVLDWQRRFDHMQQHSGQHILSQAFIRVAQAETIGFHLSDDSVTIGLEQDPLTTAQMQAAERLANQIVWENRPIAAHVVTLAQAQQLALRKLPPDQTGPLRLIDIKDFDLVACGGTHVARTGAVGLIKIIRRERRRGQSRIEFRCGGRALTDYEQKNEIVNQLTADLTTGTTELVTAVNRLQTDYKSARRAIKKMQAAALPAIGERLLAAGARVGAVTIISHVFEETDEVELRPLGSLLTQNEGVVALLGRAGDKAQFLFCRADDAPGDMNELLQNAWRRLGGGKGGGSAASAQGGGLGADHGRLRQTLAEIAGQLRRQIST